MKQPSDISEVFLQPGGFHFGERNTRIRTILGSCISIVMWHDQCLVGGMCHFILSRRLRPRGAQADGRYADEAMELFLAKIRSYNTRPADYRVKVFGGGNMFPDYAAKEKYPNISRQNVQAARDLIRRHGLNLECENIGGTGHRQIYFDIWSGQVWVRQIMLAKQAPTSIQP